LTSTTSGETTSATHSLSTSTSQTSSTVTASSSGLSLSDRIALGVGIGVGVPGSIGSFVAMVIMINKCLQRRREKLYRLFV